MVKDVITAFAERSAETLPGRDARSIQLLTGFKRIFIDGDAVVIVYQLQNQLVKVIRLCDAGLMDAMSTEFACTAVRCGSVRTDIFHDHGHWIREWIERLRAYSKDPSLKTLEQMLLSDDMHQVKNAIDQLARKIRQKQSVEQSYQLLYSALYYRNNPDQGLHLW